VPRLGREFKILKGVSIMETICLHCDDEFLDDCLKS
jgi:hypothetical protein